MALDYVRPLRGKEAFFGQITDWTASRNWLVHVTSRFDEEWQILQEAWALDLLPRPYYSVLATQPLLMCRRIGGKQDTKSPLHWVFSGEYSSAPLSLQQQQQQTIADPTQRPPKVRWRTNSYRKAVVQDIDGEAIVNSAGDYFDPPIEIDVNRWTCTVTKNIATIPTYLFAYEKAVNDTGFTIQGVTVGERVARLAEIEIGELTPEGEYLYYPFSYTMEFRSETWNVKPLQQGFSYKDGSDRKVILDDSPVPRPVTSPRLLDAAGAVLANPSPSTAVYGDFECYDPSDFGVLPGITEIDS